MLNPGHAIRVQRSTYICPSGYAAAPILILRKANEKCADEYFTFNFLFYSLTLKIFGVLITRGGVEDTRLEAKAKDIKKIRDQGQGQPFRGQTPSSPRTGMLKTRPRTNDTGTSVLQKKKVFKNFFRRSTKF